MYSGDIYEENDYLRMGKNRNDKFNGIFRLEFEGKYFRISTKDAKGKRMYVASKSDRNLELLKNSKYGAHRLVLTSSKSIFLVVN